MLSDDRPIAVLYEHPEWFRPLFGELESRGVPLRKLDARRHRFDPAAGPPGWALLFNRMSPSAHLRGSPGGVAYARALLNHLAARGIRIVNGPEAFRIETSKVAQLSLLERLGIPAPRSRAVGRPGAIPDAAAELRFPVVVKANLGGSGAGIARYEEPPALRRAVEAGEVDLGPDGCALVQEVVPRDDGSIVRVETLGGDYLYGIRVHSPEDCFDLCPADLPGEDGADDAGRSVEPFEPPAGAVEAVERIVRAAGIEVGGVEYMVDARDGVRRFYDVNALSNFVADGRELLGFDPFERLADYLVAEAGRAEARRAETGGAEVGRAETGGAVEGDRPRPPEPVLRAAPCGGPARPTGGSAVEDAPAADGPARGRPPAGGGGGAR